MKTHNLQYLNHVLECIQNIENFLKNKNKKSFLKSQLLQHAIFHNLQIMAESTKRIDHSLKITASDIPWYDIRDLRNRLVHEYLGIDLEIIWKVIRSDLPKLKKKVIILIKFVKEK